MQQENMLNMTDRVQAAGNSLSKAQRLCQELCEQYFHFANLPYDQVREQQGYLIWEYRRFAIYAHIIQDYLQHTEAALAMVNGQLYDSLNKAHNKNRGRAPLGKVAEK